MPRQKIEGRTTFTLRLSKTLLRGLEDMASRSQRSVNSLVNIIIEDYLRTGAESLPVNDETIGLHVERVMRRLMSDQLHKRVKSKVGDKSGRKPQTKESRS